MNTRPCGTENLARPCGDKRISASSRLDLASAGQAESAACPASAAASKLRHFTITRADMALGAKFAQCQHASGESFFAYAHLRQLSSEARSESSGVEHRPLRPEVLGSTPRVGSNLSREDSSEKEHQGSGNAALEVAGSIPAFPAIHEDPGQVVQWRTQPYSPRGPVEAAGSIPALPATHGGSLQSVALTGSSPVPSAISDISGTYAYALQCRNEQHLLELSQMLTANDFAHVIIREPDAPFFNQATSIGCLPTTRSKLRKLLRGLPLLGSETP